jgi:hypothetical protein
MLSLQSFTKGCEADRGLTGMSRWSGRHLIDLMFWFFRRRRMLAGDHQITDKESTGLGILARLWWMPLGNMTLFCGMCWSDQADALMRML